MAEPALVADCVDAVKQATSLPVTVKTRIGIDNQDSYGFLLDFIGKIAEKGCDTFIIHARKALLNGLSPAENRVIPPLNYDRAYQLKKDFPHLTIILNGGLQTVDAVQDALTKCDGVMIGREAYTNPWFMAALEGAIFGAQPSKTRHQVVEEMIPYIDRSLAAGIPLKDITRHILGLYQGLPGARRWRQILSEEAYKPAANSNTVRLALAQVPDV